MIKIAGDVDRMCQWGDISMSGASVFPPPPLSPITPSIIQGLHAYNSTLSPSYPPRPNQLTPQQTLHRDKS